MESTFDYPHLCGSGHTPLLSPAAISEKGVELGCVIGLHTTGGHEAILTRDINDSGMHTPLPGTKDISDITVNKYLGPAHTAYLGAQAEQSNSVINCALLSTGVQQPDDTADLRKVMRESASPNLDRTPGVVDGRVERFGDISMMVTRWERLEQDDSEWKARVGQKTKECKLYLFFGWMSLRYI